MWTGVCFQYQQAPYRSPQCILNMIVNRMDSNIKFSSKAQVVALERMMTRDSITNDFVATSRLSHLLTVIGAN